MAYRVKFAEVVKAQLQELTARQRTLVMDAIGRQLLHEPLVETRNRKRLRPNPVAPWELRIGQLRVFYEVVADDPEIVRILAVGQKKGNQLWVAGKEILL